MSKVIFIEANPFGSRLHVLRGLLKAGGLVGAERVLITRRRVHDAQSREWFATLPPDVSQIVVPTRSEWSRSGITGPGDLRNLLRRATQMGSSRDTVVLTALDDYLVASLVMLRLLVRLRLAGLRVVILKYRVAPLLGDRGLRSSLVGIATRVVWRAAKATLVVFDERIVPSGNVSFIPDPWSGEFGRRSPVESRRRLGIPARAMVVGLIGYQDTRKGAPLALNSLQLLSQEGWAGHVLILGKVAQEYRAQLERLKQTLGDRLCHQEQFVSDAQLPDYFASCDLILMPYGREFTSTSGVLARAAASGVPALATPEGLVGYRVQNYGLGWVSKSHSPSEWKNLIGAHSQEPGQGYSSSAAKAWAALNTEDALASSFAEILKRVAR